jgi:ParB family transcriptional regulator, chromosome partitioning protein
MKRGLGKGLSDLGLNELLGGIEQDQKTPPSGRLCELGVDQIVPGRYQPRQQMDPDALQELADSIKAQGIIQPMVVRKKNNNEYEIIAGERRWRAAQLAGLNKVPVVLRDIPDEAAVAMALIENIQRQDLNAVEEATALSRLIQEFDMTHDGVAKAVGKSRASVSNLLRLLNLAPDVKMMLQNGDLDMGHARALLALDILLQAEVAKIVVEKELSVRQTEQLIRQMQQAGKEVAATADIVDPDITRLQQRLAEKLGANVDIRCNAKGRGKLVISYNSLDELDGILAHIQ